MQRETFEACQTASPCPFVWVVFFHVTLGVMELQHVTQEAEMFIHIRALETPYETIGSVYGFRSQILICHILLALHQGKDEVRPDHSFEFQLLYNAGLCKCEQCTVPRNTVCGWEIVTPCVCDQSLFVTLCEFKSRLESKLVKLFWKQSSWVRNCLVLTLKHY